MVDQPPPGDERQHVSGEVERARILAAVLRDQAERAESAREVVERRTRRSRLRRGALAVVWVAMAWVWLGGHPSLRVQPPPRATVVEEASALRLQMYLQAQRVEAFRQRTGRLPFVLAETGPPPPGLTYERLGGQGYRLEGMAGRVGVRYDSQRPARELLGTGAGLLDPTGPSGP